MRWQGRGCGAATDQSSKAKGAREVHRDQEAGQSPYDDTLHPTLTDVHADLHLHADLDVRRPVLIIRVSAVVQQRELRLALELRLQRLEQQRGCR